MYGLGYPTFMRKRKYSYMMMMDDKWGNHDQEPKRLKTIACDVDFGNGNNLLHQFVLDNSPLKSSVSESYVCSFLRLMSDVPVSIANARNNDAHTPLYLAVLKNNLQMVRMLLSCIRLIDVNGRCDLKNNYTALHLAAHLGYPLIVRELLRKGGARINERCASGETPICFAMQADHLDVVKVLVSEGVSLERLCCVNTPLCHAAEKGNLEAAKFLISSGMDVNLEDGEPALVLAAESGKLATVELLVSKGANVNAANYQGDTPLHEAVRSGSLEVVKYLVNLGVNINAKTQFQQTPLDFAVSEGKLDIAAFLKDHGAVNANLKKKVKRQKYKKDADSDMIYR